MSCLLTLKGKKVLIHGSNSSLDRELKTLIEDIGAKVIIIECNKIEELEYKLTSCINENGPFDGFVYSLVNSDFRPIQYNKPNLVSEIMNFNFGMFIEDMRVLKKHKGINNGGSVVALSSISSFHAMKAKTIFCAAKAALDASIRCLALELSEKNIRINSIQKGVVDIDMEKSQIQNINAINENSKNSMIPLGFTSVYEIVNTIAFFLSDLTRTITGTGIVIDGGYTL